MNLSTQYLGLHLKNPIVPSSSPLPRDVGTAKRMEDAGASAIVMWSLFEEQLQFDASQLQHFLAYGSEAADEALSYFPRDQEFNLMPDQYLEHLSKLKSALDIPVIGSLNGISTGEWIDYAQKMQDAGADALELNIYYLPTNPRLSSEEVEQVYIDILKALKAKVRIPVAVKLGPYFTALANMALRLTDNGANGLVLFNRFYQPDIDIEKMDVQPNLLLSTPPELRLPLRWIAILHGRVNIDLAASTGVYTADDVVKLILAGASVTQMCSALLRHGIGRIEEILRDLRQWMDDHEYESIAVMKGSLSLKSCPEPAAFERANYMRALHRYV